MASTVRKISEVLLVVDGEDVLVEGEVTRIGRFTVASLGLELGTRKIKAEGLSRCGYGDSSCEIKGDDVAIGRCLKALIMKINHKHIQNHYMA